MISKQNICGTISFKKEKGLSKKWKKRFIVVDEELGELRIFRNDQEFMPKKIIKMQNIDIETGIVKDTDSKKNKFYIFQTMMRKGSTFRRNSIYKKRYVFSAQSEEERDTWMKEISDALRNYKERKKIEEWKNMITKNLSTFRKLIHPKESIKVEICFETFNWNEKVFKFLNDEQLYEKIGNVLKQVDSRGIRKLKIFEKKFEEKSGLDTLGVLHIVIENTGDSVKCISEEHLKQILQQTDWIKTIQLIYENEKYTFFKNELGKLLDKEIDISFEYMGSETKSEIFTNYTKNFVFPIIEKVSNLLQNALKNDESFKNALKNVFRRISFVFDSVLQTDPYVKIICSTNIFIIEVSDENFEQNLKDEIYKVYFYDLKQRLVQDVLKKAQQQYKIRFSVKWKKISKICESNKVMVEFLLFLNSVIKQRISTFVDCCFKNEILKNGFIQYVIHGTETESSIKIVRGTFYDYVKIWKEEDQIWKFKFVENDIPSFINTWLKNTPIDDYDSEEGDSDDEVMMITLPVQKSKILKNVSKSTIMSIKKTLQNRFDKQLDEHQLQDVIEKGVKRLSSLCEIHDRKYVKHGIQFKNLKTIIEEYIDFDGETKMDVNLEELLDLFKNEENVSFDKLTLILLTNVLPQVVEKSVNMRRDVALFGIDGAGKTNLIFKLKHLNKIPEPSIGFSTTTIHYKKLNLIFHDMGGHERENWNEYIKRNNNFDAMIFMIDSTIKNEEKVKETHKVLKETVKCITKTSPKIPLLIFANKQDLTDSMNEEELEKIYKFSKISKRISEYRLQKCSLVQEIGIYEGLDWLYTKLV